MASVTGGSSIVEGIRTRSESAAIQANEALRRTTVINNDFGEVRLMHHSHAAGEWLSSSGIDYGTVIGPSISLGDPGPRGTIGYSYNGISDTDIRAMMNTAATV